MLAQETPAEALARYSIASQWLWHEDGHDVLVTLYKDGNGERAERPCPLHECDGTGSQGGCESWGAPVGLRAVEVSA